MKRNIILLSVLSLLLFSCEEIDKLLTFRISHSVDMEIPSTSPVSLPIEIPTPEVTTNATQSFENNNTRADLVKDVKLETLELTITSPSGKNFNFLKSIVIYISTDQHGEIELAKLDEIPLNVSSILLETTDEKLDDYVKASQYALRTTVVTKEALGQDTEVRADVVFKVTAEPL